MEVRILNYKMTQIQFLKWFLITFNLLRWNTVFIILRCFTHFSPSCAPRPVRSSFPAFFSFGFRNMCRCLVRSYLTISGSFKITTGSCSIQVKEILPKKITIYVKFECDKEMQKKVIIRETILLNWKSNGWINSRTQFKLDLVN